MYNELSLARSIRLQRAPRDITGLCRSTIDTRKSAVKQALIMEYSLWRRREKRKRS